MNIQVIVPIKIFILFKDIKQNNNKVQILKMMEKAYSLIIKSKPSSTRLSFYILCIAEIHRRLGNNEEMYTYRDEAKRVDDIIFANYMKLIEKSLADWVEGKSKQYVQDITSGLTENIERFDRFGPWDHVDQFLGDFNLDRWECDEIKKFLYNKNLQDILKSHFCEDDLKSILDEYH